MAGRSRDKNFNIDYLNLRSYDDISLELLRTSCKLCKLKKKNKELKKENKKLKKVLKSLASVKDTNTSSNDDYKIGDTVVIKDSGIIATIIESDSNGWGFTLRDYKGVNYYCIPKDKIMKYSVTF